MEELIDRLIRCGVPPKTAECICKSFTGKITALEKIVLEYEKNPCTTGHVGAV